jgi:DNA modification methylase
MSVERTGVPARRRLSNGRTSTSNFGVGRRESHDASGFYRRFEAPVQNSDAHVPPPDPVTEPFVCGDARDMRTIAAGSVALVVTSPPYFAGKQYEEELEREGVPSSYLEYLEMLTDVFAECVRTLEPGGRIAVNVANLGRKPYRSLAADVISILQDDLKLLLRGEIIWQKAQGASGNCAWGSFQSARNPVLRDLTERIIVASKGRFDRALPRGEREKQGLPTEDTIFRDDFMAWTTDIWDVPPESATRVGHPAPFPVELPQRLIELYTFRGDLVLDPFMGSGSTAVAAVHTHRRYFGFDTDPDYVEIARARVAEAEADRQLRGSDATTFWQFVPPALDDGEVADEADFQSRAVREGRAARDVARQVLEACGFEDIVEKRKVGAGVEVNFVARGAGNSRWYFDVSGAFSKGNARAGLRRTDTLWKALGKAAVLRPLLRTVDEPFRFVLLTTDLPPRNTSGATALTAARSDGLIFDAVEMLTPTGQRRLSAYATDAPREPMGELLS